MNDSGYKPANRSQARAWSEPRQAPQDPQNSSPWFSDLRSKLSTFNMTEWLSSLGIGNKKNQDPSVVEYFDDTPTTPTLERRHSMSPIPALLTPTAAANMQQSMTSEDEESFELPTFWLNLEPGRNYKDTLELQHFGPLVDLRPLGKPELGKGHEFGTIQLSNPTWCDKCGDFIWGFYKQAVMCSNCKYTCHYKCRMLVTLDCNYTQNSLKSLSSAGSAFLTAKSDILSPTMFPETYNDTSIQVEEREDVFSDQMTELTSLSAEEFDNCEFENELVQDVDFAGDRQLVMQAVQDYNNLASENRKITVDTETCRFSGYIPVYLNFTRPINVVSGQRPASIYDVIPSDDTIGRTDHKTIQSFYLPRNTMKTLHINSDSTTRELIVVLLRKFRVADNPLKFALYEKDYDSKQTLKAKLRRISDDACPLRLALAWGCETTKRFVLQENDTGDIMWDAFAIPELNNFLRILDMEEQQYIWQIKQKYNLYKYYLELEIREKGGALHRSQAQYEITASAPTDDSPNDVTNQNPFEEANLDGQSSTNPFESDVHEAKMDIADNETAFDNEGQESKTMRLEVEKQGSKNGSSSPSSNGSWHYYGTL